MTYKEDDYLFVDDANERIRVLQAINTELLEALETLLLCHSEGGYVKPDEDVLEGAREAIRKAKEK